MTVPETINVLKEISPKIKLRTTVQGIYRVAAIHFEGDEYIFDII